MKYESKAFYVNWPAFEVQTFCSQTGFSLMHGTHGKIGKCGFKARNSFLNTFFSSCSYLMPCHLEHFIWVFLRPSVLHVTICAIAVECCCLISIQPTFPSGMKTRLADIQSNRFCNLSAQWDHKRRSLLNLNSSMSHGADYDCQSS